VWRHYHYFNALYQFPLRARTESQEVMPMCSKGKSVILLLLLLEKDYCDKRRTE
jgi:hypothetical protein